MSKESQSKARIIFSDRNFTAVETKDITDSFSKILPTEEGVLFRESLGDLPAVIILILIGEGFFRAIGSDIYKQAKQKLIKILKGKYSPSLNFEIKLEKTDIKITTHASNEQTLNKIFDTIADAKELVMREIEKRETPEMTEINLGYTEEGWQLIDGRNWNYDSKPKIARFYKYNKESKNWELTQDLSNVINAYFKAKDAKS